MNQRSLAARAALAVALLAAAPQARSEDALIRHATARLNVDLAEMKMIASDPERFRARLEQLRAYTADAQRELREAEGLLDAAGRRAGFEPSGRDPGTGDVRFSRRGSASGAVAGLRRLELPRAARLRWIRCDQEGCAIALGTFAPADRLDDGSVNGRYCEISLPERPGSPERAEQWDRVQAQLEQCRRDRAALGELADVRRVERILRRLIDGLEEDAQTPRITACAAVASEVNAKVFTVDWSRGDFQVAVPDASPELETQFKEMGLVKAADGTYAPVKKAQSVEEMIRELKERASKGK